MPNKNRRTNRARFRYSESFDFFCFFGLGGGGGTLSSADTACFTVSGASVSGFEAFPIGLLYGLAKTLNRRKQQDLGSLIY